MTFDDLAALIRSRRTSMLVQADRPVPHDVVEQFDPEQLPCATQPFGHRAVLGQAELHRQRLALIRRAPVIKAKISEIAPLIRRMHTPEGGLIARFCRLQRARRPETCRRRHLGLGRFGIP
jgi:hypothetical protein